MHEDKITPIAAYGILRYSTDNVKSSDPISVSGYKMYRSDGGYPICFPSSKENKITVQIMEFPARQQIWIDSMEAQAGYYSANIVVNGITCKIYLFPKEQEKYFLDREIKSGDFLKGDE